MQISRWRHQMETFSALLATQRPVTRSFDVFLWPMPEQTAEQTIETPVIWDVIVLIMTSLLCILNTGFLYNLCTETILRLCPFAKAPQHTLSVHFFLNTSRIYRTFSDGSYYLETWWVSIKDNILYSLLNQHLITFNRKSSFDFYIHLSFCNDNTILLKIY